MTHCPRCQLPLPEPPIRFCPSCGYDTQAVGEPLVPGGPPTGGASPPPLPPLPASAVPPGGGTPWERRHRIGLASAFVETTQQVLTGPSDFFRRMPVTGGIASPLLYGLIAGYIGLLASALYSFIMRSALGTSWNFGRGTQLEQIMPMLTSGAGMIGQVVFGPVFVIVLLFVVSAIIHVCLLALGGATSGFEGTFRVAAYANAAAVVRIVPVCGDLFAILYYVVLAIIGVSEAHRISGVKAAAAVLLPFVLLCCCCGVGLTAALGGLAALLGQAR